MACPLTDCGRSGIAHKDLKVHWQQECQQVSLTCTACGFVARRPAMQSHFKCSELDKKERAEDKELIQKLVQNNEMLVKENSQLKQQLQTQHLEESKEKPQTTSNQSPRLETFEIAADEQLIGAELDYGNGCYGDCLLGVTWLKWKTTV